jgi:putative ABC transport system permease protein
MMEWFNIFMARLRALFRRESVLRDIEEELRVHVQMETETNIKRGMPPDEARAAALKSFGNLGRNTELGYDVRGGGWLETLWQDLRYGARMLLKNPGFTLITLLTLALGIGANTAIFSVVNGVLLSALPYKEPERLVMAWADRPITQAQTGQADAPVAMADFVDWRDQNQVFEQMAAMFARRINLTGRGQPEAVGVLRTSASLFPLLGTRFAAGRAFLPEEDRAGADRVVVISHALWQRRYAADPNLFGQKITLNDEAYTVIGVTAPDFQFPRKGEVPGIARTVDLYLPLAFTPEEMNNRMGSFLRVIARLKPGVSLGQASSEMNAIARRLTEQYPQTNTDKGVRLALLHQQVVGKVRTALLILLGAVGFVLLIACANVANLLLARAAGRQKEMALRAALGASRGRVMRQLLTESLLLALAGGAAGLLLAWWGVKLLLAIALDSLPRVYDIRLDIRVAGFTLLVSLATGIVFGLLPALQASKLDLGVMLKEGGRDAAGLLRRSLRGFLVVSEVALAFVLLIGAGLLMRSFARLMEVDPGLDPRGVLTMDVMLPPAKYSDGRSAIFFQQTLERVRALPGVEAAATVFPLPMGDANGSTGFAIEGRPSPTEQAFNAGVRLISPDFFKTFRIPLLKGRLLAESDDAKSQPVVVINESLARIYFANEDPLGKRIIPLNNAACVIVGVVGDVKSVTLDNDARPEIYWPMAQSQSLFMSLAVRASGNPMQMVAAVRGQVWAGDKNQPVTNIETMEGLMAKSVAPRRFNLLLLGVFALVGLALAGVGLYGVMSYTVTQRTREIGVRMAMGAQTGDMLRLVIGEGVKLALIGVLLGVGGALALTRLLTTLLFGVSATDPLTFIVIAAVLIIVALSAGWIPARRATKVDPMIALRCD